MSVPNQNIILIERKTDKAAKDFFKIGNTTLKKAAHDLDGKAFKLYIYLADNSNGYRLEMYPIDFCQWADISDSSYRRAFKELLEKHYLIQSNSKNHLFLFQEESDSYNDRHPQDSIKTISNEELQARIAEDFKKGVY